MSTGRKGPSLGVARPFLLQNRVASVLPMRPVLRSKDSQPLLSKPHVCWGKRCFVRNSSVLKRDGAVEWIRTTTVLLPPAPQAGASASSATTAPFVFNELGASPGACFAFGARLVPVDCEEIAHFAPLVYFRVTPRFCHISRASSRCRDAPGWTECRGV
jgi:hypothetical protein